jgi:N-formylglutamate amidohydrolase
MPVHFRERNLKKKDKISTFGGTSSEISLPLSILFTCPHGGNDTLDDLLLRQEENYPSSCRRCEKFEPDSDVRTTELTNSIADKVNILSGGHVRRKIARIDRLYIDFNRDVECAIEPSSDATAENEYHNYHKGILKEIKEMHTQNENGLQFLFDIHGTGLKKVKDSNGELHPVDIIIGTDQGRSIHFLTEVNTHVFWGANGLIQLLRDKDIRVWPPDQNQETRSHILDGGYTIKTYGSTQFNEGLVAIQCEVILAIREDDQKREQFAGVMAECIWNFVKPFI